MRFVDSARRQIVMAVLLGLAIVGAAVRYWAPDPSTLRDVGTLLLVLWLPAVGNLVGFVIRKFPRRARNAGDFAPGAGFTSHLVADLVPLADAAAAAGRLQPLERRCTVVAGSEGFSARLRMPVADWLREPAGQSLELEFLRPELALAKLVPGTGFHIAVGATALAAGRVVRAAVGP